MDYYSTEILIPAVDETNQILEPVERHFAHKTGVLHRGFTLGVYLEGKLICQHRKHPLFDDCLDLTASSHPMYTNGTLVDIRDTLTDTLIREWNIGAGDLLSPFRLIGKVYYRAEDNKYIEHEICEVYTTEIARAPVFNPDFAYGYKLLSPPELSEQTSPALAPWVKAFLKEDFL